MAAVLSMRRSMNQEIRLTNQNDSIQVATVMPWAVDTPWWTHAANYTGHQPRMSPMDDPEIVVDAIVKACTDPHEETPVGFYARASDIAHHIAPSLTEHMSANVAKREAEKAAPLPPTTGSIYQPMEQGSGVEGGIRERMKAEDRASH
jgi:short-subunit dehydrogenase